MEAGVGGVLYGNAEDVVYERGHGVKLRSLGDPERLKSAADAFENLQHRGPPGRTEELGADPGVGVDRIEHPKGDGADRLPRLGATDHIAHDTGDDVVGGRRQKIVLVGDVPVDRSAPCRQAGRQRPEGQSGLALRIEDLNRRLDDPLLRERVRASFGSMTLGAHEPILTRLEQCSNRNVWNIVPLDI